MITAFFVALIVTVLTFVYCGMLVPTAQMDLKYRLFRIRDGVRSMMDTRPKNVTKEQLDVLHSGVTNAIRLLPDFDIMACYYFRRRIQEDEGLRKVIDGRLAILESCNSEEFQELRSQTADLLQRAFMLNIGLWFLILVPIALVCVFAEALKNGMKKVFCFPEGEFEQLPHLKPARS